MPDDATTFLTGIDLEESSDEVSVKEAALVYNSSNTFPCACPEGECNAVVRVYGQRCPPCDKARTESNGCLLCHESPKPSHEKFLELKFSDSASNPGLELINPAATMQTRATSIKTSAAAKRVQDLGTKHINERHGSLAQLLQKLDDLKPGTPSLMPNDPWDGSDSDDVVAGFKAALQANAPPPA